MSKTTEATLDEITVVVPHGMFLDDNLLEQLIEIGLRLIAQKCGIKENDPEKYGADFENDIFSMHQFCWCDEEKCEYCREEKPAPNFRHKASNLQVHWYKYIGRSMEIDGIGMGESDSSHDVIVNMILSIIRECLDSIKEQ